MRFRISFEKPDLALLGVFVCVVIIGFIALASASQALAASTFGDSFYFIKRQALHIVVGIFAGFLFFVIPPVFWKRYAFLGYLCTVLLLAILFIPGIAVQSDRALSWISLGFFAFQPSEFAKFFLIIFLAFLFERKRDTIHSFSRGTAPFLIYIGIVLGLVLLQPDPGTMLILGSIAVGMFFAAGARLSHIGVIFGGGAAVLAGVILAAPYRIARITAFLRPEQDPEGTGYHILRSLAAIRSGGFFGQGLGKSVSKFSFLPEAAGDSIFAVFAEELGFLFSALLIILFVFLLYRGIRVAQTQRDMYHRLLATGIMIWIGVQTFMNIGAMVNLMPLTGIPLPFISYGGSALISAMAAMGMLLSLSQRSQ